MKYLFAALLAASAVIVIGSSSEARRGSSGFEGSSGLPTSLRLKGKERKEQRQRKAKEAHLGKKQTEEQDMEPDASASGSSSATSNALERKKEAKKKKVRQQDLKKEVKHKKMWLQNVAKMVEKANKKQQKVDKNLQVLHAEQKEYRSILEGFRMRAEEKYGKQLILASTMPADGSTSKYFKGYIKLKEFLGILEHMGRTCEELLTDLAEIEPFMKDFRMIAEGKPTHSGYTVGQLILDFMAHKKKLNQNEEVFNGFRLAGNEAQLDAAINDLKRSIQEKLSLELEKKL